MVPIAPHVVGAIEAAVDRAASSLNDLERFWLDRSHGYNDDEFSESDYVGSFQGRLETLFSMITMALEAAGLRESRLSLVAAWSKHRDSKPEWVPAHDYTESIAFDCLRDYVSGLRMLVHGSDGPIEHYNRERLEDLLRSTPVLLRRRNVVPKREKDIQDVMHDYLAAALPTSSQNPGSPDISSISSPIRVSGAHALLLSSNTQTPDRH